MLFTSATVLLIGLVRWYLAMSAPARPQAAAALVEQTRPGLLASLSARLSSAFAGNGADAQETGRGADEPPARPRHGIDRSPGARRPRPARQSREREPVPSRQARPRRGDIRDDLADAPPRPRRESGRRPDRDDERAAEPRRRAREPREPREPRRTPPPPRREPRERRDYRPSYRDEYPPRPVRGGGYEPYEPGSPGRGYPVRPTYDPYPPQGPRRRPAPGSPEANHHPVSRVRYRESGPDGDYPDRPVR